MVMHQRQVEDNREGCGDEKAAGLGLVVGSGVGARKDALLSQLVCFQVVRELLSLGLHYGLTWHLIHNC